MNETSGQTVYVAEEVHADDSISFVGIYSSRVRALIRLVQELHGEFPGTPYGEISQAIARYPDDTADLSYGGRLFHVQPIKVD